MRLVTLIVNPAAGRAGLLQAQLPAMGALLRSKGIQMETRYTSTVQDSAERLAGEAIMKSSLVIACGGDGTIHGVLQGMANSAVPLGVLPLGTANALARNLKLPLDPLSALERLLTYAPLVVPLGEVKVAEKVRFFLVMAGCGPDGALAAALSGQSATRSKAGLGRSAYYLHAARLFLTRRWPRFPVEFRMAGSNEWTRTEAVAVLASRMADLGGLFSRLTPLAELSSPHLHVHLLRPPAHLSMAMWFGLSRLGLPNPLRRAIDVEELRCLATDKGVYCQVDAEPIGPLPMSMCIGQSTVRLMLPSKPDS